jgi:hypothetical protein
MSIRNRFHKHKRAILALVTISLFIGSLGITVFTFSQSSTNYTLNLLTNQYLNLLIANPSNYNLNAKDYPIDWQLGNGEIEIIEKNASGYYTYSDPWIYHYVDEELQAHVIHSIQNPNIQYLLISYRDGWNLISTSSGTLVPYQDTSKRNYYWIQFPTENVTINFTVNHLYNYDGIKMVTGNEPFTIFGDTQTLTRSGNTFRFTPLKQYYMVTDTLDCYKRDAYEAPPGGPLNGFEQEFTYIGKPSSLTASDNNCLWQGMTSYSYKTVYIKGFINPADYRNLNDWKCYQIDVNYEGHAYSGYSHTESGFDFFVKGYWDTQWWWDGSHITMGDSDQFRSKTWYGDFNSSVGLGVRAWVNWIWNLYWVASTIDMKSDRLYGTCYYEARHSTLLYHSGSFNTNDEPYLIVRYRTSPDSPQYWNLYLTSGDNKEAKTIPLNKSTDWATTVIPINDGNTYDGFYLKSSNWNQWIEFDYILTGNRIEVNSLYQDGEPCIQVWGDKSTQQLGTYGYPLYVSGTIREMDGYFNPAQI